MTKTTTACVMLPAERLDLFNAERLARRPELDLHFIPYSDPPEVRQARKLRQLTPALAARCPVLSPRDEAALARAEIAIARDLPLDLGRRAPRLRWVQAVGAGIEQLDPPGLAELGITLTNASGVAAAPIAEFVMAQLLAIWKELRLIDQQQRDKVWRRTQTALVAGKTLGIVGLGAIGRATATRARAFQMHVLGTARRATAGQQDPDVDELFPLAELDRMLTRCDAVLASMPATPDTAGYFDAARFAAFKPGAIFCNVSRGAIVDEPALLAALDAGRPARAVLDVTAVEPNPPESPLWHHPSVHLSPHSSTSMEGYGERLVELFLDNLARWQAGEPLRNVVDPGLGY
ncbi:MAG: D-2-hydroxyacid dehydrogenase [Gammaproteobacteria bacterium]|nr:D-2-hydroxyacid dehydrogenase [Gammaproteobacteria bacterium]